MLNQTIQHEIRKHATQEGSKECCGLIVEKDNHELISCRCRNVASDPFADFEINPVDYIKCSKLGKIAASYHSHSLDNSLAVVSYNDRLNSSGHKLPMIVYHKPGDKFIEYNPKPENHYTNRPYEFGKYDCWTLIIDFFKNELGINVKNTELDNYKGGDVLKFIEETYRSGKYVDVLQAGGFNLVENLQIYDLILGYWLDKDFPAHIMLYIGNGKILHQTMKEKSEIVDYSEFLKKKTHSIWRHVDLWTKH